MTNKIALHLRAFPVKLRDNRSGEDIEELLVLDKSQLQAAQLVGQSSRELIERICARQGFAVLETGRPDKHTLTVELTELYCAAAAEEL